MSPGIPHFPPSGLSDSRNRDRRGCTMRESCSLVAVWTMECPTDQSYRCPPIPLRRGTVPTSATATLPANGQNAPSRQLVTTRGYRESLENSNPGKSPPHSGVLTIHYPVAKLNCIYCYAMDLFLRPDYSWFGCSYDSYSHSAESAALNA